MEWIKCTQADGYSMILSFHSMFHKHEGFQSIGLVSMQNISIHIWPCTHPGRAKLKY